MNDWRYEGIYGYNTGLLDDHPSIRMEIYYPWSLGQARIHGMRMSMISLEGN